MANRFTSLLEFVFQKVNPDLLLNLQVGNEIDAYDVSNEGDNFWSGYGEFLFRVHQYLETNYPNIKMGYTATYKGAIENNTIFSALNNAVDIMGITYYPLQSNFDVDMSRIIESDLNALVNTFTAIPIYLQEIGYQTSSINNSSQEKQANFYCNFFSAWDLYADRIASANIVRLNDLSQIDAEASAGPYGISDQAFTEYLRTLGLRTNEENGKGKLAFQVIKDNLKERGW